MRRSAPAQLWWPPLTGRCPPSQKEPQPAPQHLCHGHALSVWGRPTPLPFSVVPSTRVCHTVIAQQMPVQWNRCDCSTCFWEQSPEQRQDRKEHLSALGAHRQGPPPPPSSLKSRQPSGASRPVVRLYSATPAQQVPNRGSDTQSSTGFHCTHTLQRGGTRADSPRPAMREESEARTVFAESHQARRRRGSGWPALDPKAAVTPRLDIKCDRATATPLTLSVAPSQQGHQGSCLPWARPCASRECPPGQKGGRPRLCYRQS